MQFWVSVGDEADKYVFDQEGDDVRTEAQALALARQIEGGRPQPSLLRPQQLAALAQKAGESRLATYRWQGRERAVAAALARAREVLQKEGIDLDALSEHLTAMESHYNTVF